MKQTFEKIFALRKYVQPIGRQVPAYNFFRTENFYWKFNTNDGFIDLVGQQFSIRTDNMQNECITFLFLLYFLRVNMPTREFVLQCCQQRQSGYSCVLNTKISTAVYLHKISLVLGRDFFEWVSATSPLVDKYNLRIFKGAKVDKNRDIFHYFSDS